MTPSEMEEAIRNLNAWAAEISQNLPLLATKEDLKTLATKEELAAAVANLATKADVEDAKRSTEHHILVARQEIRQVDDKVTAMAADVKSIAEQVAILTARRRT